MSRNPLDKEKFMEGNRQKWAVIFIFCGMGVLITNLLTPGFDPTPYMQFLLAIGSLFILGGSVDSWVKAYSVKSIRETEIKEDTIRMTQNIEDNSAPDNNIIMDYRNQFANDPSYAPADWVESFGSEGESFR